MCKFMTQITRHLTNAKETFLSYTAHFFILINVLQLNYPKYDYVVGIYPIELEIQDTTDTF